MSKNILETNTTELITQILASSYPELARNANYNALKGAPEEFVREWSTHADQQRFLRNTAPKVPGDDQESVGTKYPQPKPVLLPVPDPAETESGGKSKKKSIPDYTDPSTPPETTSDYGLQRFQLAVADVTDAAGELWEKSRYSDVESDDTRDLRRRALDAAQELLQSLYGF